MSAEETSFWVCGTLGKVHGLGGRLYLNLAPGGLGYLDAGVRFVVCDERGGEMRPCILRRAGGGDARPLIELDLASSREEAVALQGLTLLASGGELDEIPHYRTGDLIGRRVREQGSGAGVGTVSGVLASPAHDILEVRLSSGGSSLLVPLVRELVWEDDDGGLTVRAGLLDIGGTGEARS